MRLLRVGRAGSERPAGFDADGVLRDLASVVGDIDGALLADDRALAAVAAALGSGMLPAVPPGARRGAPVARPGKVVGIGLNYRCYAAESGAAVPERPVVFLKPGSTVCGPEDGIELPPGSTATDHEVELGVVVGRTLRRCDDPARALGSVGGYVAVNDVTERHLAADGPTWAKGKCCDTFTPAGPWLVTPDDVADPQALALELRVNGELRQRGSTADMAFSVAELLCYLSGLMTLEPGDLLLTGTPAGVAAGRPDPKPFLRDGDVVELEVEGLGRQRTPVRAAGWMDERSGG
ncbi:fumarylacetoacetate hydrolase family protein [Nocardioides antri]|uniref:Fumarylacetoacetate hydrolase family protein n=1 Tax=Nocardioides antri TaxID=2607659 RepID=A0A5B1M343_9ACTN|nr:fumarylacetoacetate hydrolase family protein [Nocardioides antri]KAA1426579.1 fumarylacetoacetate hydrolase family protein [Nocardioides antri]